MMNHESIILKLVLYYFQGSLAVEAINRKELVFTACDYFVINYSFMCSVINKYYPVSVFNLLFFAIFILIADD